MLDRNTWLYAVCAALAASYPASAQTNVKAEKAAKAAKCENFRKQRTQLEERGVRKLLEQDPAVVAATLTEARRQDVRLLIELDEKVKFECRMLTDVALVQKGPAAAKAKGMPKLPVRRPKSPDSQGKKPVVLTPVPLPERAPRP